MFSFHLVHLILSMGIIIIKHYITEVEKQNKFYEKMKAYRCEANLVCDGLWQ